MAHDILTIIQIGIILIYIQTYIYYTQKIRHKEPIRWETSNYSFCSEFSLLHDDSIKFSSLPPLPKNTKPSISSLAKLLFSKKYKGKIALFTYCDLYNAPNYYEIETIRIRPSNITKWKKGLSTIEMQHQIVNQIVIWKQIAKSINANLTIYFNETYLPITSTLMFAKMLQTNESRAGFFQSTRKAIQFVTCPPKEHVAFSTVTPIFYRTNISAKEKFNILTSVFGKKLYLIITYTLYITFILISFLLFFI